MQTLSEHFDYIEQKQKEGSHNADSQSKDKACQVSRPLRTQRDRKEGKHNA